LGWGGGVYVWRFARWVVWGGMRGIGGVGGCLEEEEGGGDGGGGVGYGWMWGGGGGLERCRWRGWMDGWMDGECADILGLYYVKSIDLFGFFG